MTASLNDVGQRKLSDSPSKLGRSVHFVALLRVTRGTDERGSFRANALLLSR